MPRQLSGMVNCPLEWAYQSARPERPAAGAGSADELELDVVVTAADTPAGPPTETWRVPAFWAGGGEWRVRFAPPRPGRYTIRTECSDPADAGLHGQAATLEAVPYDGTNDLLRRGGLRVAADRRHFEHADGTPFFWLGDTWWMGLCRRWSWPADFQLMTADRAAKGFTVIQIVAGLYPDMPGFDPRGANETGFPWEADYVRLNPVYFDMADLRIQWLVRAGLVPCIVAAWGYYLPLLGEAKMKRHWRNLVARWGAWPVVWCLAGEAAMPYYLSKDKEGDRQGQKAGWTELARYVRRIDPWRRPITIHPTDAGRNNVEDPAMLDFDMLQTGHGGPASLPVTVRAVTEARRREPAMPFIDAEVEYEGIIHGTSAETSRLCFWAAVLSGAAGHTYGANGIWQINNP
ncbi:MAG: DUF4038 domain-containing protein, partial [bacterium]|nr:DUF4038 domain-containing protein [bacterium]